MTEITNTTFLTWVRGVLFRPADAFQRARTQLRFGYWWIILSAFTLETVIAAFTSPEFHDQLDLAILGSVLYYSIIIHVQTVLLLVAARTFQWPLTFGEALKYVGLGWSVQFIEDVILFYPMLAGWDRLTLWLDLPFFVWYVIVMSAGLGRVSGLSRGKALLLTLMATLPWWGGLFALNWYSVYR
jgi:hypothetical protein